MTYWAINAVFLVAVVIFAAAAVVRLRRSGSRVPLGAALLGLLGVLLLTAVFDNVIIGLGIVDYDPAKATGLRLGLAPLEDFAYAIAASILLPALWCLVRPGERSAS